MEVGYGVNGGLTGILVDWNHQGNAMLECLGGGREAAFLENKPAGLERNVCEGTSGTRN